MFFLGHVPIKSAALLGSNVIHASKRWELDHEARFDGFRMVGHPTFAAEQARGVERVDERRVSNEIFWVLCSGVPWQDLPEPHGPCTTCYNRFNRWRKVGV